MDHLRPTTNGHGHHMPHAIETDVPGETRWIVQKYGGTSLGKVPVQIVRDIIATGLTRNRIAVVCSARSTHTKSQGTTNRLLRAAREATRPDSRKYYDIIDIIRNDHIKAGSETIQDVDLLQQYLESVDIERENLAKILEAAQHLGEVSSKTQDKIVATGEKLSCLYMTTLLHQHGIKAKLVDLSDCAQIDESSDDLYGQLTRAFAAAILDCGDAVPVITGFFGTIPNGVLDTFGRGYTDLCAALVAVSLRATELQIWKEVDGIFTADPRKVPTASLLETVTPAEAAELTFYGSEVVHPSTMDQAIRASIPIRIKNVMNPRAKGTVIWPDAIDDADRQQSILKRGIIRGRPYKALVNGKPRSISNSRGPKRPTAVTVKSGITVLNIHSRQRTRAHGFLMSIFSVLDKHKLSVDLISSSEVNVSLALHTEVALLANAKPDSEEMLMECEALRGAVHDLGAWGDVIQVPSMAIVSLVGRQLREMTGISGRFFSVLCQEGINIEMISQGASEINISCVIDQKEADRALNVVHTALFTFLD